MTPHWHDQNPWNDHLIYVPIEELAQAVYNVDMGTVIRDGKIVPHTAEIMLEHFRQYGDKLDAYILTGVTLTGGVRFGPEGPDYLSPGFSLPKLAALLKKYRSQERKSA